MENLKDKVAVITGGSSGIGKATTIELAKAGCKVVLFAKTKQKLLDAFNEIKTFTEEVTAVVCDVRNYDSVEKAFLGIIKKYNTVDILVNCAGIAIRRSFKSTSIEEAKDIMGTNFFGTVNCIKAVLPAMTRNNSGAIVNIGSLAGIIALPDLSFYSASKFAIVGLSEALHYELKQYNIQVSLINPAATNTNIFSNESWQNFPHEKRHPKLLAPEEVAVAIVDAINSNKFEVTIPYFTKLKLSGKSFFPSIYRWYINKLPR